MRKARSGYEDPVVAQIVVGCLVIALAVLGLFMRDHLARLAALGRTMPIRLMQLKPVELSPDPTLYDKAVALVLVVACFALGVFAIATS
jgi:hypothetical protein